MTRAPLRQGGVERRQRPAPHGKRIEALERLAHGLDSRFRVPIIGWRIGWDSLIGLIPGIGDTATAALSAYIILQGWRLGVRKRTLARMIGNAGLDLAVGSIPILGDVFDMAWKANTRNIDLILADLTRKNGPAHRHPAA